MTNGPIQIYFEFEEDKILIILDSNDIIASIMKLTKVEKIYIYPNHVNNFEDNSFSSSLALV